MKKILILFLITVYNIPTFAQDLKEHWKGALDLGGMELRLVINIEKTIDSITATLDSPDQNAYGIPVSEININDDSLIFSIKKLGAKYAGARVSTEKFIGEFSQSGRTFPLELVKSIEETKPLNRPQEPKEPYPYKSEEITFANEQAGITLAGTFTTPKGDGKFPTVILITGSGPQNRNEELLGHKPFLVLSDFFTRNGIAVLRYDDRGVGDSQGDFKSAISTDFASDVESAVNYLMGRMEVDKIGLIGHSEGGLIAPMVAAESDDVDFIILMAGPGIRGDQILLKQQALIQKANGETDEKVKKMTENNSKIFKMIVESDDVDNLKIDIDKEIRRMIEVDTSFKIPEGQTKDQFIKSQIDQVTTPWFRYFMKYDPQPTLAKVKCPVLAINGEKDLQVPAEENLKAIREVLEQNGNDNVTTLQIPKLNHLFQTSTTGSPNEYNKIEETFSPIAMSIMLDWIKKQVD